MMMMISWQAGGSLHVHALGKPRQLHSGLPIKPIQVCNLRLNSLSHLLSVRVREDRESRQTNVAAGEQSDAPLGARKTVATHTHTGGKQTSQKQRRLPHNELVVAEKFAIIFQDFMTDLAIQRS